MKSRKVEKFWEVIILFQEYSFKIDPTVFAISHKLCKQIETPLICCLEMYDQNSTTNQNFMKVLRPQLIFLIVTYTKVFYDK